MRVDIPAIEKQRRILSEYLDEKSPYDVIASGGPRFVGKTWLGATALTLRRLQFPGTMGLALRLTKESADLNMGEEIREGVLKPMGLPIGRGGIQFLSNENAFRFPNGGMIKLGYCKHDRDWEQYQGVQWADVWWEEATQFPELSYDLIGGSNRPGGMLACRPRRLLTFNPGGVGNEWVRRRIVNESTRDRRVLWVKIRLDECLPTIERDPGYALRNLRNLDDYLRRQWEEGDFDAVSGQYFLLGPNTVQKREVPRFARWYAGVDYGDSKPFAVIYLARWQEHVKVPGENRWVARDHAHIASELYQAGLDVDEQAHLVNEHEQGLRDLGICQSEWISHYADPSAHSKGLEKEKSEIGRTIAGIWKKHGFTTLPARTNNRVAGWKTIKLLFRHDILTIDPSCGWLLRELQDAICEGAPGPPISEDLQQGPRVADHALDALRYVVVSTFGIKYQPQPLSSFDWPDEIMEQ